MMTTFSDPPLSQFPDASIPQLFSAPTGSQMQVFVDPGGILGRPKLVRLLKKLGAFICSDPKHAQFILVDSNSDTGRQFIRDWGLDQNKVVLEHTWVAKSLAARKLLRENDEWGGCGTYDDGLPIGKPIKDIMDEVPKSPLPTPRITPIEPGQPFHSSKRILAESSSYQRSDRPPHHPPSAETAPPYYSDSTTNGIHPQSSLPQHGQANMITQFSHSQPSEAPTMQFAHLQPPQANPIQQLLQSQPGQSGVVQFQPQMFMNSTGPPNSQVSEQSFVMSLLDIMKSHGIDPWSVTQGQIMQNSMTQLPFFAQQYMNSMMQHAQDQQTFPLTFGANSNISNPFHSPPSPEPSIAPSSPRSRMIPPSLRRKSTPSSPPPTPFHSHSKGKGRADSPNHSRRKSSYTDGPSQSPYAVEVSPLQHAQTGKIFTSKTGEELAFFVQIDLNNRLAVVNNIKKHGGKITNSHTVADYSILYSRSKTFPDLLKSTIAAEKPAVTASFVHDSVAENTLKDPDDYLFNAPATLKRKRPRATPLNEDQQEEKVQRRREEKTRRQAERKKKAKEQNTAMNDVNKEGEQLHYGTTSPSPPPKSTRVQLTGGKYQFSESEREYLTRYVRFLLERDHLISNTAISHKLFSKMPNHTQRSWQAFMSTVARDEVEVLRKKAGIAHRKAESADRARQEQREREVQQLDDNGDGRPPKRMKPSGSPLNVNEQESVDRDLEEDFNVICQFFATDGPGDEDEDPVVTFDRLTNQAKCKSAPAWVIFYNMHNIEVNDRFYKLTNPAVMEDAAGPDEESEHYF